MAKEIERAGLPTAQICNMTAVAEQVGSNRIVNSASVLTPTGDARLQPNQEKDLRRGIVRAALTALLTPVEGQQIFQVE